MSGLRLLVRFVTALADVPVDCFNVADQDPAQAPVCGQEFLPPPTKPGPAPRFANRTGPPGIPPALDGRERRERTRARAAA